MRFHMNRGEVQQFIVSFYYDDTNLSTLVLGSFSSNLLHPQVILPLNY